MSIYTLIRHTAAEHACDATAFDREAEAEAYAEVHRLHQHGWKVVAGAEARENSHYNRRWGFDDIDPEAWYLMDDERRLYAPLVSHLDQS